MWAQLRNLATQCGALLLDRKMSFAALGCLVLMGTVFESIGIGLVMPLIASLQGQESSLARWFEGVPILGELRPVVLMALLVAAAFVLKGAAALLRIRWSLTLVYGLWQRWVNQIVEGILFSPLETLGKHKSGALMATTLVETRQSAKVLLNLIELLVSSFTLLCIYSVLWLAAWQVTLVLTIVLVLLVLAGLRPLARAAHAAGSQRVKSDRLASIFLLEIIGGVKPILS